MSALDLKEGSIIKSPPFLGAVSKEPVVLKVGSKTVDDMYVTASYFGVYMGSAFVSTLNGVDTWEWTA